MKKISFYILCLLCFGLFKGNVLAISNNSLDFTKKGSTEITLKSNQEQVSVANAEITIYKIAIATEENHNLKYELVDELQDCDISIANLQDETIISKINECNLEKAEKITKVTNKNGLVLFDNLELGIYLVKQTKKAEDFIEFDSFLAFLPQVIDDAWTYNIKAKPKTDIIRVMNVTVKKVWNTNNSNDTTTLKVPEEVTIELYNDRELIDTVFLNKKNNWSYTWNNLAKSDKYYVKEINIPRGYTVNYDKHDTTFIVTNTTTLVNTGQPLWLVSILAALGTIFLLLSVICYKRDKNEKNN